MVNRLKNALWLIVGAVVAVWAVTSLVGLVRAGDMDPPGPPGGTLKPLYEIEPRTAIWQPDPGGFPIIIDQPGSYYLGRNITGVANKDGIHIRADNVTLDLNGFTVQGVEGSFNGITVPYPSPGTVYNLSIFNGTIRDWGNAGIGASDPNGEAVNSRLADLSLMDNGGPGVRVGDGSTITRVTALGNGQNGIQAGADTIVVDSQARSNDGNGMSLTSAEVRGCVATSNVNDGINVTDGQVFDSWAYYNGRNGISLGAGEVRSCVADTNKNDGIEVAEESLVVGNVARDNGHNFLAGGYGIHVTGSFNRIEGNTVSGNGNQAQFGDGIHVTGSFNRIEGNDVQLHLAGAGIDSSVGNGHNLIIKNSASQNWAGDYVTHASDTVGPIIVGPVNPIASPNPWANFSY